MLNNRWNKKSSFFCVNTVHPYGKAKNNNLKIEQNKPDWQWHALLLYILLYVIFCCAWQPPWHAQLYDALQKTKTQSRAAV